MGGLAARYPAAAATAAAAYIQTELKALSIALSRKRLRKCRQREEREVRRGGVAGSHHFCCCRTLPKLHVVRAHGCVWQGKSQGVVCLSIYAVCCGEGEGSKDTSLSLMQAVKVRRKGEKRSIGKAVIVSYTWCGHHFRS